MCSLSAVTEWTYDYREKPEDFYCVWELLGVQRKLGDPGAEATRALVSKRYSREVLGPYIHAKVVAASK